VHNQHQHTFTITEPTSRLHQTSIITISASNTKTVTLSASLTQTPKLMPHLCVPSSQPSPQTKTMKPTPQPHLCRAPKPPHQFNFHLLPKITTVPPS
jgi:hypothetical protein